MSRSHELPWSLRTVKSFTRREANKRGVRWRRLAADDLEHPFHGILRPAGSDPSVRALAEAYAKRMPQRQVFSHETAAAIWGVPLPASAETTSIPPAPAADDSSAVEPGESGRRCRPPSRRPPARPSRPRRRSTSLCRGARHHRRLAESWATC